MKQAQPPLTKERITATATVYNGSVLSVEEKSIDFGNGNTRTFEVINWNVLTGVSALPFFDEQTVLLLEHYQAGIESTCLTLPTGGLAVNEDPQARMNLELQEEIGYRSQNLQLMCRSHVLPGYIGSQAGYLFIARDLVPSSLPGDEPFDINIHALPLAKALAMVQSGEIIDSRAALALLYYHTFMKDAP